MNGQPQRSSSKHTPRRTETWKRNHRRNEQCVYDSDDEIVGPHVIPAPPKVGEMSGTTQPRHFVVRQNKTNQRLAAVRRQSRKRKKPNSLTEDILIRQLQIYYTEHPDRYDLLRRLVQDSSKSLPSLRELEYVITNSSRTTGLPDIHHWYKDKLSDFTKKHFDPFRRTKRILFTIEGREKMPIWTTVAQLNWSREVFKAGILDWLMQPANRRKVREHMRAQLRQQRSHKRKHDSIQTQHQIAIDRKIRDQPSLTDQNQTQSSEVQRKKQRVRYHHTSNVTMKFT